MRRALIALILSTLFLNAGTVPRPAAPVSIVLPDGKQVHPADYKGKEVILVFFLTTCPHCKKTLSILNSVQRDLGPKGLQVLAGAINAQDGGDVPKFIAEQKTQFPVGGVDRTAALGYMQMDPNVRSYVPFVLFIDKAGLIQAQYMGSDPMLADEESQEKNLREEAAKLLPAATAKRR